MLLPFPWFAGQVPYSPDLPGADPDVAGAHRRGHLRKCSGRLPACFRISDRAAGFRRLQSPFCGLEAIQACKRPSHFDSEGLKAVSPTWSIPLFAAEAPAAGELARARSTRGSASAPRERLTKSASAAHVPTGKKRPGSARDTPWKLRPCSRKNRVTALKGKP